MKAEFKKMALTLASFVFVVTATAWTTYEIVSQDANRARPAQAVVETQTQSDAITEFRTEREQLRQLQKSQLNDIIYGSGSDEEIIQLAQRQILDMLKTEEQELTLEGVLKMRGFEDVLVTVHSDSINVVVRQETITQQETAVILELVMRETGIGSGNVKILPII